MENTYNLPDTDLNLLSEFEVHLERASTGKRFGNMLIDAIAFYVVYIVLILLVPASSRAFFFTPLLGNILGMVVFALFFGCFEAATRGKTLGKLLTRTRAVQEDGSPITTEMAFIRGFSRIVPFEAFSALGSPSYPWHDRWSHTFVIDEAASSLKDQ
ncbi:MAG TPA: RDD family protein [Puia sp.]|nr:RDD family protein [Puia sp.]